MTTRYLETLIDRAVIITCKCDLRRGQRGTLTEVEYPNDGPWVWIEFEDGEEGYYRPDDFKLSE